MSRKLDGLPELLIAQTGGYLVSLQAGGNVQPDRRFSPSAPVGADIAGATELVLLPTTGTPRARRFYPAPDAKIGNGQPLRLSSRDHTPITLEQADLVGLVSLDGTRAPSLLNRALTPLTQ